MPSDDLGLDAAEPTITLGKWLEELIERLSDPAVRSELSASSGEWSLRMCVDQREPDASWAEVVVGDLVMMRFQKRPRSDRVQRIVSVPFKALLICGELWEDSKAKLATRDETAAAHV